MKFLRCEPKGEGRFLRRYDLHYEMADGHEKVYEMVSRRPVLAAEELSGAAPEGVVLVILNQSKTRVLLNREFRPAVNRVVYNFPAGMPEPGESLPAAAARELAEETGLTLSACLACYGCSYGAIGISNEVSAVFFGQADDTQPFGGEHAPAEEIEPVWVKRAEAARIARGGAVTGRVQMFLVMWAENGFMPEDAETGPKNI
ncbi:MAG: NUDIX domain-containing protein [Faecalibacterium sp.]|jgi:ADP-ribose pyrophosphatase|nr:NUDIX domain-containing protein [Faecalibacterium sp.]